MPGVQNTYAASAGGNPTDASGAANGGNPGFIFAVDRLNNSGFENLTLNTNGTLSYYGKVNISLPGSVVVNTSDFINTGAGAAGTCTTTVSSNSSTEYQAEKRCQTDSGMAYEARIHFTLAGRHRASGTVDVLLTQTTGKLTTMHHTIDAQWLAADCGTIKDVEMEP